MPLKSGDLLDDKYQLLHTLGRGGFGEVWLARDTVLGDHHVAIKFLTSASPEKDKTFLVEMRALAGLNLPGIVTFYHHFRHQKQLALVMEYCEHGSLRVSQLLSSQPLRQAWVNQVVKWVLELCDTLTTVHARGLVHHDIKPPNILLRDDVAVIADFGIVNSTIGTIIYSSPSKCLGLAARDDAREDIYALGVTLLELLNYGHPWISLSGDVLEAAKRQRTLPVGRFSSMTEIAAAEGIDVTQVRRIIRLTVLAPDVIERLTYPSIAVLEQVMRKSWPINWSEQEASLFNGS